MRKFLYAALCDESAACSTRARSHFDQMIGCREYLHVMIDKDYRVAVGDQIFHHGQKPLNVARMQTDGGFVQNIEDTGGAVAYSARQLHALTFAR